MNKRIDSLDYLRGLAALSVMFFHYYSWVISGVSPVGFMSKIGLYAVSIFYVLSGLTLYTVYVSKQDPVPVNMRSFFTKRFFRIFPLLWLVLILTMCFTNISPSLKTILLNFTGLFGVIDWVNYIGAGVWSIGNELCFYLLFPLFWLAASKRKFSLIVIAGFFLFVWFSFFGLDSTKTLQAQWDVYVNPMNQVFLFIAGMSIGRYAKELLTAKQAWLGFIVLVIAFVIYPAQGINLVTGLDRIVLGLVSIGICLCVFHMPKLKNELLHRFLKWMGDSSYSIYLLHPILYAIVINPTTTASLSVTMLLPVAAAATLIASYLSFRFYESRFVKLGSRFSAKKKEIKNIA